MLDPSTLLKFERMLTARGGGYLRNPIREPNVTCAICTTPCPGYLRCMSCNSHVQTHRQLLADAVAPLTYAVRNSQTGYMMRGFKATPHVEEHRTTVSLLTWLGIGLHTNCVGTMVGLPVTHWATVPSLPSKPGEHPFHRIVAASPPTAREATLVAAPAASEPRDVTYGHFNVLITLPPHSHVLVMDDTWTKGGHAQSAALTLREAGAEKVSIMVAARWINPGFASNTKFINERLVDDFDPKLCPWTGSVCP